MSFRNLLAVTIIVALAACGGGKSETSSSTTTTTNGVTTNESANPSPSSAAYAPAGGMASNGEAMAPGTLATVPPGMTCGAVQPVWVNTKTHVYHEPSDPYYGRTKHGQYLCPSQAKKEGYHKAGGKHEKSGAMSNGGGGS